MAKPIYKVLIFLKRRPGMSLEEFREYYEGTHVPLCSKYTTGVSRYVRRYVQPLPNAITGSNEELEFDVITELWLEDRDTFDKVLQYAARGILPQEVIEDEERVFDRRKIRYATVIESS